ncbi:hypothetical protein D9613_000789 [Agrocybe pediades]|uniref:Velvet domain-containing protein n=1 Tax=Agrocybe pediades TaxID=84607 RepID=A0A8H4VUP0_9AGAR|nr:hypothetical protein D9613_000789 [Agrocybe pediades]
MELGLDPHHRQNSGPDHIGIGASATRRIGDPVTFVSGQFAGRTIRLELEEIQKADSGRKYAKVDRRPLDPPPAVLLRLFETDETGAPDEYSSHTSGSGGHHQPWEKELSYENVLNVGLICSLDLFPVPESIYDVRSPVSQSPEPASTSLQGAGGSSHRAGPSGINRGAGGSTYQQQQAQGPLTYFPLHPYTSLDVDGTATVMQPFQIPRRQLMLATVYPTEMPPDVIHRIGSHLVTESSKLTPALVGEKFAEPTLVDYKGEKVLIFVFGVSRPVGLGSSFFLSVLFVL